MGYKNSSLLSAMNLLRLALGLVIIGFFLPIGCKSNGVDIANGILGKSGLISNTTFMRVVDDIYGYLLFGVIILVVAALVITFLSKLDNNFLIASILMGVSLGIIIFLLITFDIEFNFKKFIFTYKGFGKINFLPGFYLMFAGYALGIVTFILKSAIKKLD